ncbi:MAG: prepilin peptidase [Holosporales bacterium]
MAYITDTLPFVNQLCVLILIGLLTAAAVWDAATFTIPNWISLILVALFIPYMLSMANPTWGDLGWRLLVATIIFGVGFGMFAVNVMGGGDVKLMTAVALFVGANAIGDFVLAMALCGGALCIGALLLRPIRRAMHLPVPSIRKTKVPYGLAICAGGYAVALKQVDLSTFFSVGVL